MHSISWLRTIGSDEKDCSKTAVEHLSSTFALASWDMAVAIMS